MKHALSALSLATFLLATGATWFLAVGLTQVVGGACAPLQQGAVLLRTDVATSNAIPTPANSAAPRALRATTIVVGNPFDSETRAAGLVGAPGPAPASLVDEPRCAGGLRLVVAAVDDAHPERSLAIVETATGSALDAPMVRLGSSLPGGRVARIGSARVWLERAGRPCWIGTSAQPIASAGTVAPPIPAPPPPLAGIARIDDTHTAVDRTLRDRVLESPSDFIRSLQILPETRDGKTIGLRLVRVLPGSLFSAIGLRAADVVTRVNGFDVGSPESMLTALGTLRSAPSLEVALIRDGAPTSLTLEMR